MPAEPDGLERLARRIQHGGRRLQQLADQAAVEVDRVWPAAQRKRALDTVARAHALVSDPAFQAELRRTRADLDELTELYETSPVAFLVDWLDPRVAAEVLRADLVDRDVVLLAVFERALLEPRHLDAVAAGLEQAAPFGAAQHDDVLTALELLRAKPVRWAPAARLLLGGYEGALWRWAEQSGAIDQQRNLVDRPVGQRGYAKTVGDILKAGGLPVGDEHRRFVSDRVFDSLSSDIRHGRATIGHRECAVVVLLALDALLDETTGTELSRDTARRANEMLDDDDDPPPDDASAGQDA